jgi:hypothetical protein
VRRTALTPPTPRAPWRRHWNDPFELLGRSKSTPRIEGVAPRMDASRTPWLPPTSTSVPISLKSWGSVTAAASASENIVIAFWKTVASSG